MGIEITESRRERVIVQAKNMWGWINYDNENATNIHIELQLDAGAWMDRERFDSLRALLNAFGDHLDSIQDRRTEHEILVDGFCEVLREMNEESRPLPKAKVKARSRRLGG